MIENIISNEEESKKDTNPLSVRVDPQYKDIFEDIVKQKGIPKKNLMEAMITNYIESGLENKRNSFIDFSFETSLLSGSLDEILSVFKTMVKKAQNTVGSQKSFYEQQINNLDLRIQTIENKNSELEEKNKLLEAANNGYILERENYNKAIDEFKNKEVIKEKEIVIMNSKNTELLEQINILRKVEKENVILKGDNEKAIIEIGRLKSMLDDKNSDIERLNKKIDNFKNDITEIRKKNTEVLAEIETRIRKDFVLKSPGRIK